MGGQRFLVDITVVHTTGHIQGKAIQGAWAAKAAQEKTDEYQLMMKFEDGAVFVPLAFESWGGFGEAVDTFLERLLATQDATPHAWAIDRLDELRVGIAVAIQEGNYIMARRAQPKLQGTSRGPPRSE